jgi:hypothetical protein
MFDVGTSSKISSWYSESELQNCRRETAMLVKIVRQHGLALIENCPDETFLGLENYYTKQSFREHAKRKQRCSKKVLAEQANHRNELEEGGCCAADINLRVAFASLSISKSAQLEARCRASQLRSEVLEWEGVESCPEKNEEHTVEVTSGLLKALKHDDGCMNALIGNAVVIGEPCLTAPRRRIAPGAA